MLSTSVDEQHNSPLLVTNQIVRLLQMHAICMPCILASRYMIQHRRKMVYHYTCFDKTAISDFFHGLFISPIRTGSRVRVTKKRRLL
jgi:hypothetical protein